MNAATIAWAFGLALVVGCGEETSETGRPTPSAPAEVPSDEGRPSGDEGRGRELLARFECQRCHEGTGLVSAPFTKQCRGCHDAIHAGTIDAPVANVARWRERVTSFRWVPSLAGAGERFHEDWLVAFLDEPHDVRPALAGMMPRLEIDARDARDLAAALGARAGGVAEDAVQDGRGLVSRGRRLMEDRGCPTCHAFTGVPAMAVRPLAVVLSAEEMARGAALAPDLRHVRERVRRERIVEWIVRPRSVAPESAMPDLGVSEEDARAIAAYLVHAEVSPPPVPPLPARLPLLDRPVGWDEVEERVFERVCWHCHSNAELALGDGGPGNTGGFGFRARGVSFARYEEAMSGRMGDDGERESIFAPRDDGTPLLLATLLARQREQRGDVTDATRGMPLGLPALSPEDIQLVETWIAQGRPR